VQFQLFTLAQDLFLALHFAHYNFCRIHQTLRVTPAMAAGIADHIFSIEEIVDLLYRSGTIAA